MKAFYNLQRLPKKCFQLLILCIAFGSYSVLTAQEIKGIEYFFGEDPGFGNGTFIIANTNTRVLIQNINVPLGGLSTGFHTFTVRAQDSEGVWGLYDKNNFYILNNTSINNINAMEYWFDQDPGLDNGTLLSVSGNPKTISQSSAIPISNLSQGFHTLNVRARNSNNTWGLYDQTSFFVLENTGTTVANLTALEYWFDTDPGFGNGIARSFSGNPTEIQDQDIAISLTSLTPGFHKLGIRARNTEGTWSTIEERMFYKFQADSNTISPIVEELEFSAGEELVLGTGQTVPISATGNPDEFIAEIPEDMLSCGIQNIWVSLKNADGNYALYNIVVDVEALNANLPPEIITFNNIEVQLDDNGEGTLTIDNVDSGTNDCDLVDVTLTPANPAFTCSNLGANVVTITATDETGLSSSKAVNITVVDAIEPTVVVQNIAVELDDVTGSVTIIPTDINNGSTDNCGINTMTLDVATFTIPGTYPVALTVTDNSGNTNTETALVTVTTDLSLIQPVLTLTATNGSISPSIAPTNGTYDLGTTLELTATPDAGYTFIGWSGNASGSDNPLSITLNSNTNITAEFSATLSTNEVFAKTVSLYPNPTTGNLTVSILEDLKSIEIFTLLGSKTYTSTQKTINISHLPQGVYIVKISTQSGKTALKKVIKN